MGRKRKFGSPRARSRTRVVPAVVDNPNKKSLFPGFRREEHQGKPLTINFERKAEGNSVEIGKPPIKTNAFEAKLGIIREEYLTTAKPGTRPQISRRRKIAFALQDEVERQLRDLERKGGIIDCEEADWASPIVAVRRSNGDIRVCGAFRQLKPT